MGGASAARLPGNRLHLQHGPIDLIIAANGPDSQIEAAYHAAADCFIDILPTLVSELHVLRMPSGDPGLNPVSGPVANRMVAACHRIRGSEFITPMAAVAGSVADHVLNAMTDAADLERAYVNNGGDIALYLSPGTALDIGLVGDVASGKAAGTVHIDAANPVRGIATSGRGGRSCSLGIADAVTVLADTAALADAAATLIANAVDCDDPGIQRQTATLLDPDSDLGARLVTVAVPKLPNSCVDGALQAGLAVARRFRADGIIRDAALTLQDVTVTTSPFPISHKLLEAQT